MTCRWNGWTKHGLQPQPKSDFCMFFFFNLMMHFRAAATYSPQRLLVGKIRCFVLGILLSLALLVAAREREHEEVI